jgi:hypothetical protein
MATAFAAHVQLFDHNSAKSLEIPPNTSSLVSGPVGNPHAGVDSAEGWDPRGVRSERLRVGQYGVQTADRSAEWVDEFDDILAGDAEYAERLHSLVAKVIAGMVRACVTHSDITRLQWQSVADKYRERWAQGDLDGIMPVIGELMSWLRNAGVEPLRVAGLTELVNDPALVRVRRIVVIDWDTNLVDVLRTVAGAVAQAPKLNVVRRSAPASPPEA